MYKVHHMQMENKWLPKQLKMRVYIPNLIGEKQAGRKAYMGRTNGFLDENKQ